MVDLDYCSYDLSVIETRGKVGKHDGRKADDENRSKEIGSDRQKTRFLHARTLVLATA